MAQAAAAGLSAVGSIVGGITGGKGAKKAASIQQQTTNNIIAANERNREYVAGLYAPTIERGNAAGTLAANFYGVNGGDAAKEALATYRGSTGYADLVREGLGGVNANAYARGLGESGAAYKALLKKGMSLADQSSGTWLSGLDRLQQYGQSGMGAVAGNATTTTINNNGATQTASDANANAALVGSAAWQRVIQGLTNAGGYALGSSFGGMQ